MNFDKEKVIDAFLQFIAEDRETQGLTYDFPNFEFNRGMANYEDFKKQYNFGDMEIELAAKACISRKFVEYSALGGSFLIHLTTTGYARAMSCKFEKNTPQDEKKSPHIGSITIHGNTQIGNGNIQNITNTFNQLKELIEKSDASEEEKNTALNYLNQFIEHPLVCSIISGAVGGIAESMK